MEIEIEEVEKEDVVKKKKGSKKKYLYALGVILVAGLFLGSATHIPIGVQFVTPALGSVSYFFGGHPYFAWYYFVEHQSAKDALIHALYSTGIGYILDWLGIPLVTSVADVLASLIKEGASIGASLIIEAFTLAGVSASIIEIIIPLAAVIAFW